MARRKLPPLKAPSLSEIDLQQFLYVIGHQIRKLREEKTTQQRFAYEIGIGQNCIIKYEKGGDMYLSSFLKVLTGLETTPEDFFHSLNKNKRKKPR